MVYTCVGFNETVYSGRNSGQKFDVAAAKLNKSVLRFIAARLTIKGRRELRMAPDISGPQMKKILDVHLAKHEADEEELKTGEGGDGYDNDEGHNHLAQLRAMRDNASQKKKAARSDERTTAEYRKKLETTVEKVKNNRFNFTFVI